MKYNKCTLYNFFLILITPNVLQLLFPTSDSARPFSMLGLGDIVIPGKLTHLC